MSGPDSICMGKLKYSVREIEYCLIIARNSRWYLNADQNHKPTVACYLLNVTCHGILFKVYPRTEERDLGITKSGLLKINS